jgi:hypothetical protein
MRPALRLTITNATTTAGSFATYNELADDRDRLIADLEQAQAKIAQLESTVAKAWADINTLIACLPGDGLTAPELRAKYAGDLGGEAKP